MVSTKQRALARAASASLDADAHPAGADGIASKPAGDFSNEAARRLRIPLLVALVGGAIAWLPRWPGLLEGRDRAFLVDPAYVEVASGPAWLSGTIAESLRDSLAALEPTPLRRDDEVVALTDAIQQANGWVKSIDRIEKRYPNSLEIEVTLREPVALVESESGLVLVDAEAHLVSTAAAASEFLADHELPLIHASHPLRDARVGTQVRDGAIAEGLRVAAELAPFRAELRRRGLALDVIDVTPKERSAGLSLTDVEVYTRSGLAIEWGRSRRHPELGALEPTADAKVRGLFRVAARYPEFAGIKRVRLQFTDPTVLFEETAPLVQGAPDR